MSLPGLIAALVLTALVVLMVASPLLRHASPPAAASELQRERVLAYYEHVLATIRDLDEDFALGKLNEADYHRDREIWAEKGVQALKLLDALETGETHMEHGEAAELDAAVEQAVQAAIARVRAAETAEAQS